MVNPGGRPGSRFSGTRDRDNRRDSRGRRFDRNKTTLGTSSSSTTMPEQTEVKVDDKQEVIQGANNDIEESAASAKEEKKFTGRCRLFVGNISPDTAEEEFLEMFKPFGECSEIFLNAHRAFGFIRMDYKENAEKAKKALDGITKKGRMLRVRYAAHSAAIRVKYIHSFVSNELLHDAFSMFGEIERAVVCIDDKGKPNGEAIVEFARKPGAIQALKRINEGVFLLGSSPRPVVCELVEHKDEEDGLPEVFLNKNPDYHKERGATPRFASQGTFEYNFSQKWKELYSQHEQRKKTLQDEFDEAVSRLEMDEASALMEHQTAVLREDLLRRQEELRKMEEQHQMELQKRMDQRLGKFSHNNQNSQQNFHRRQQEEAKRHMDEERRREDEARMFMQQELAMRQMQEEHHMGGGPNGPGNPGGHGGNAPPMQPPPAPPAGLAGPGGGGGGGRSRNPNEMNMSNRGMQQMHPNMGGMQGPPGPGNQQQMQNLRGSRKRDSDYRQSRFDQPPQQFQGGNQQMGHQQHMGGGGGGGGGGIPGNMMFGGPQGGPHASMANNMGGGPPQGNSGNMGGQGNMGGPGGQMMRGGGGPGGNPMAELSEGDFIENKRNRRF